MKVLTRAEMITVAEMPNKAKAGGPLAVDYLRLARSAPALSLTNGAPTGVLPLLSVSTTVCV